MSTDKDTWIYKAVVNHEEQYSIWLADRKILSTGEMLARLGQNARREQRKRRYRG
jgi:uncharacterized protein YbdZ (MbtH family)